MHTRFCHLFSAPFARHVGAVAAGIAGLTLVPVEAVAQQSPQQKPMATEHTSSLGVKFVPIPGTMVMFAEYETRVSDYESFVKDATYAWSYKPHFAQGPDHPAVGVNLQDAIAFCNWLTNKERAAGAIDSNQSYRLPTNEEWDAAINLMRARKADATLDEKVQDERIYPWGLKWPPPVRVGNYAAAEIPGYEDDYEYTAPVGKFPATKEGIYDLAGNVWEWVWDRKVQALPVGGLRGGSWAYFRPECLTSAYRYEVPAELRAPTIGFRCVFEDRRRTATLMAQAEAKKVEEAKKRGAEMAKDDVDPKELEAMRAKLKQTTGAVPNVAKLAPAEKGKAFTNSLGMEFVPLGERGLLAGKFETRLQDFNTYVKETEVVWDKKPAFLSQDTQPVVAVSWLQALDFCEWLTNKDRAAGLIPATARYRLPTDAEWSTMADMPAETGADPVARHLGNKLHYPWGNDAWPPPPSSVNIDSEKAPPYRDSFSYPAPVGSFAPNGLGFHDLGGNASEWCADPWPGAPDERVVRGGSWLSSDKTLLLSSARVHVQKGGSRTDVGFRCVIEF
ncbi:MAG: formylglycine-generating enzyme family protein [Verrucomicrobiaceae bacterium]|nr:formylglycine-generating enzyme family protein [Verrucomicrobiaceae bacterium]